MKLVTGYGYRGLEAAQTRVNIKSLWRGTEDWFIKRWYPGK